MSEPLQTQLGSPALPFTPTLDRKPHGWKWSFLMRRYLSIGWEVRAVSSREAHSPYRHMTFWPRPFRTAMSQSTFFLSKGPSTAWRTSERHPCGCLISPSSAYLCKTLTSSLSSEQRISEMELIFNHISTGMFSRETKYHHKNGLREWWGKTFSGLKVQGPSSSHTSKWGWATSKKQTIFLLLFSFFWLISKWLFSARALRSWQRVMWIYLHSLYTWNCGVLSKWKV